MKILFILGESGAGKTTLEKHLVDNYGFKMFDKLSSRPPRHDDSGYIHFSAKQITDMYVDGLVHECVKYDGHIYAMRIPHGNPDDKYVSVVVPSGYHQFIDMDIEKNNEVHSIFLINRLCGEWMQKRGDDQESINRRLKLNDRLCRYSGSHEIIDGSRGVECVVKTLELLYPKLFQ